MKYALILILLIAGCAVPVDRHVFPVYKNNAYMFRNDGIFLSNEALGEIAGNYLGKDK